MLKLEGCEQGPHDELDLRPTVLPILSRSNSIKYLSPSRRGSENHGQHQGEGQCLFYTEDFFDPQVQLSTVLEAHRPFSKSARSATSHTSDYSSLHPVIHLSEQTTQPPQAREPTTQVSSPATARFNYQCSLSSDSETSPVQVNVFMPQLIFDDESITSLDNLSVEKDPLLTKPSVSLSRPNFPSISGLDKTSASTAAITIASPYATSNKIVSLQSLSPASNSPRTRRSFHFPSTPATAIASSLSGSPVPSRPLSPVTIKERLPFLNFDYSPRHISPKH